MMKKFYGYVKYDSFIFGILFFVLTIPSITYYPFGYSLMKLGALVAMIMIVAMWLNALMWRQITISAPVWIFTLIIMYCDFRAKTNGFASFVNPVFKYQYFTAILAIDLGMQLYPDSVERGIKRLLMTVSGINLLTQILYPNGLIRAQSQAVKVNFESRVWEIDFWFLGDKNAYAYIYMFLILLCMIGLLEDKSPKGKFINLSGIIIAFVSSVISKSSTTIVCVTVLIVIAGIVCISRYIRVNHLLPCVLAHVIFFVSIVILSTTNGLLSNFVTNVLGKDLTFTGRTAIWGLAMNMIAGEPIFGYGSMTSGDHIRLFNMPSVGHCHNMFLEIILQGGIIAVIFYTVYLLVLNKNIRNARESKVSDLVVIFIFSLLISYQFEGAQIFRPLIYAIYCFCYHAVRIRKYEV